MTMREESLNLDSIVAVVPEQTSCELDGEAVILHVEKGIYYGLNPVGARIWELIAQPRALREVRDTILAEYDVSADRCEQDIFDLIGDLSENQLVEIR